MEPPLAQRRRLPTKTRSGIITLPESREELPQSSEGPEAGNQASWASEVQGSSSLSQKLGDCDAVAEGTQFEARHHQSAHQQDGMHLEHSHQQQQPQEPPNQQGSTQPIQARQSAPIMLAPSAKASLRAQPKAVALPAQRRGSYQNLKRRDRQMSQQLFTNEKPTHWERYGVVALLLCGLKQNNEVLQMLLAEGYEVHVVESQQEAAHALAESEALPDLVLIDADMPFNTLRLIEQVTATNVTVATVVMASPMTRPDAVTALLAGAADHMSKPVDMDELVARVGRHVQRQHSIKNSRGTAGMSAAGTTSSLAPGSHAPSAAADPSNTGAIAAQQGVPPPLYNQVGVRSTATSKMRLASVAENDFQEQMEELSRENQRLLAEISALRTQLIAMQSAGPLASSSSGASAESLAAVSGGPH